jgi:5'-3' exonuclease
MGVKGLYSYLKKYRKDCFYETIAKGPPLRIGFDAMSMLYKYKSEFPEMYPMLRMLKANGHKVLFVFDGKTPTEKEAEVKERRDLRESASTNAEVLRAPYWTRACRSRSGAFWNILWPASNIKGGI